MREAAKWAQSQPQVSGEGGPASRSRGGARILVAIPALNEEIAIPGLVLRAKQHAEEVVVVDDGSTDRTRSVAELAGAVVISSPRNEGKGRAVRRAFAYARERDFDVLVLMDGDGQHDPDEIPLLLEPITGRNGSGVDLALGFRFGKRTEMPTWRRFGKRVLDYATAAGGGGTVTDSQCGFRAFGRRAIVEMATRLRADGFGVESEQLVIAQETSLAAENVTISCRYDGIDGSTKGPIEHALGVLMKIIEIVTAKRPLIFVGVPSLLVLLGSVALGIFTLQSYNQHDVFSIPYALSTATLALIGTFGVLSALVLNLVGALERRLKPN